jgi:Pentapeptide repeats (8 copies)
MKNYPYRGDFTLSIPAMGGERFLTVMGDHKVLLQKGQTERTTFRLYCNGMFAVFVTPPMVQKDGKTGCYAVRVRYQGDLGEGGLTSPYDPEPLQLAEYLHDFNKTNETFLLQGKFIVGANPGFTGPEDRFHLHPIDNPMFRPNKWKITKVRGLPLDNADMRYIDFSLDSCAVRLTNCNLREADLAEGYLSGSTLTGSNLSNAKGYKVIFGEPGKPSTLDDTTWNGALMVRNSSSVP